MFLSNNKKKNIIFLKKYFYYIFIMVFILSLFLETTFFAFPFLVIFSLLFYLLSDSAKSLILIFLSSFALDALKMTRLGLTPLFIFVTIFILKEYERLFELKNSGNVLAIIFSMGIIYSIISNYPVFSLYSILLYILLFFPLAAFLKNIT